MSFTAESYGYLAVLYLLRALIHFYKIQQDNHTVDAFIDNKGLLQRLCYEVEFSIQYCQFKGAAVIREIKTVEKSLLITFKRQHVKSHVYDKEQDYRKIPTPNLINKRSDIIAEKAYLRNFQSQSNNTILPSTTIYMKQNKMIHTDDV